MTTITADHLVDPLAERLMALLDGKATHGFATLALDVQVVLDDYLIVGTEDTVDRMKRSLALASVEIRSLANGREDLEDARHWATTHLRRAWRYSRWVEVHRLPNPVVW